jgi:hypothetical protein
VVKNTKIEIINTAKTKYDITEAITSVTWSGDYQQSARKLDFSMVTSSLDKSVPKPDIPTGSTVILYEKNVELSKRLDYLEKIILEK